MLASTSPYRRELLGRLGLPFTSARPDADESALPGESPEDLVTRLAESKARSVARHHSEALVIGSDQVAVLDGEIIGKPGTPERATLKASSRVGPISRTVLHAAAHLTSGRIIAISRAA